MDKVKKPKKEQPTKNVGKDKNSSFITDIKSMKEHIKIKEILRNVKMNSSMRLKAPKGSKIMQNKDFTDDFDEGTNSGEISASATNVEIVKLANEDYSDRCESDTEAQTCANADEIKNSDSTSNIDESSNKVPKITIQEDCEKEKHLQEDECLPDEKKSLENNIQSETTIASPESKVISRQHEELKRTLSIESNALKERLHNIQTRERKLSLDQTMLNRRASSFSQSELDLHSIGKSPLERKSSFFRKKLENFFKNTTEVFKRQSLGNKSDLQRRSSMSMSLQSLNEDCTNHNSPTPSERLQQSNCSLQSSSTIGCSTTSLQSQGEPAPQTQGDSDIMTSSQPALCASQPIANLSSESIDSLTEAYIQETMLNSRAISMSSGLDSANGTRRRKASRSNRVTWLASEGWTNYLRRVIQDEKNRQIQECHSYQDLSSIPENYHGMDSKGRRLSYQRAVSGEDPMPPPRYQDTSLRKRGIPENSEANFELSNQLAEFTRSGVPSLKGFCVANVPDEALAYLLWAEYPPNIEDVYDWKKLPPNEEARQAVIRELVSTEADYIRHLISIVEVFIAAAHALQDSGKLLDVDTERLFSNIPDVLNASLCFWEITIHPMLADAMANNTPTKASCDVYTVRLFSSNPGCAQRQPLLLAVTNYPMLADVMFNKTPFNTELMAAGFCRFRDLFQPYEKYVKEQTKALDYLRSLSSNTDFMTYLTWCHGHKSCNRLQLSDIMVKPMQRLTKYSLILRRIIAHTDIEPERTNLIVMESFAKNYVLDLNRSIRQREELERLDALSNSIEVYDLDLKDEELERYFRLFCQLNLKAPMVNCLPTHSRTLIHQGDLRFRDSVKEYEVRVFLLTDMLLICKKLSKNSTYQFKQIRPKYMVDKMIHYPRYSTRPNSRDITALLLLVVDEVGTAYQIFALTESAKDTNPHATLKLWDQKLREAKLTYELGVWFAKNPSRDLSEVEMDSSSDYAASGLSGPRPSSDDVNIEREARERVAAMLHRSMGASTECDFSQASLTTDSFDASGASGARTPGLHNVRHPMHRNSTGGSSRNSRLSSFHQSTSAASHDEPQAGPSKNIYKAGTSVEHLIPPQNPADAVTSITVNVVSESESETVVPAEPPKPPTLQQTSPTPSKSPSKSSGKLVSRSPSAHKNTLRVQPQSGVMALVHSLPDLTIDPSPPRPPQTPSPQSASEKLYQSHQELLQRNRLSATQHHQYLTPDHRGTSYPPPSPTRASLKRGLAFSYSFKNPPLSKMGHVNSQSQLHADPQAGPSTSQKSDRNTSSPQPQPSTSSDKGEKKSKFISSRHKGARSLSPTRKEDKGAD